jgi:hypothetical protein
MWEFTSANRIEESCSEVTSIINNKGENVVADFTRTETRAILRTTGILSRSVISSNKGNVVGNLRSFLTRNVIERHVNG